MELEVTIPVLAQSGPWVRQVEANDPGHRATVPEALSRRMSSASLPGPSGDRQPMSNSQFPRQFAKWSETPAPEGVQEGQFFLEVFSGTANLTLSMRQAGWNTLPPIDIECKGLVLESCDVMDPQFCAKVVAWLRSGKVAIIHFGTPCTTFSRARRNDGGPAPLRSNEFLFGIPGIPLDDMIAVQQGTSFLEISLEWGAIVLQARGFFSLENPESSMLWLMPQTISFVLKWSAIVQELCMCAFGSNQA